MKKTTPIGIVLALLLSGCATNCTIFSRDPVCEAQLVGLLIVTAPVMAPYAAIKAANEKHAAEEEERKLEEDVRNGDLAASERCLFVCSQYAYDPVSALAAGRVLAAHRDAPDPLTPRQQALLFAAHKHMADVLGEKDPQARRTHLSEVARLGQSVEMWQYVRRDDNDLPVNDYYFSRNAGDAIVDMVALEHLARRTDTGNPELPLTCDLTPFQDFMKLADAGIPGPESLCAQAQVQVERDWKTY
ncbi:MAG: hypothetical protein LBO79_01685 [Zoogloeaceae bacterium]|jgi:hypothetical protein|nr:hypothetical protein [Zoogloeaceae bacterium]